MNAQEPLADLRQSELVGEHRRHAHGRDRDPCLARALEQVDQGQVAGGDRLEQPLLAEGPGAEALHVGHVRMQDDAQVPAVALAAHGRQTASRSSERSSGPARSAKSRSSIAGTNQS